MSYRFVTVPQFRRAYRRLSRSQQDSAKTAFRIFRVDPFDDRLRTHVIHSLSAAYRRKVYSVHVEGNLRAVFFIDDDKVVTLDIGTHDIYQV